MPSIEYRFEDLPLAQPFVISRGARTSVEVVQVTLTKDHHRIESEATPTPRYQQTSEVVADDLDRIVPELTQRLTVTDDLEATRRWLNQALSAGVARNALDCALWKLQARIQGVTLEALVASKLGEPPRYPEKIQTVQTLSIDTPAQMARQARAHAQSGITLFKVKLDGKLIEERMLAIREAVPEARLVVDANEAFSFDQLEKNLTFLARIGVLMVEQPLPAGSDTDIRKVAGILPLCADESAHTAEDIDRLKSYGYDMVNIKLDKCGGLTEAIRIIESARKRGMDIMLGCMLCSSRAIRMALPIAARARLVDIDGPTWLARDTLPALHFSSGYLLVDQQEV